MRFIEYKRVFADAEGCSHFETLRIELESNSYAPPALPLNTSTPKSADKMFFLELPAGWFGAWHPTPARQWMILMAGECEFELGDGNRFLRRSGDIVLLDDLTGKGHQTRVIGDAAVHITAVHFT